MIRAAFAATLLVVIPSVGACAEPAAAEIQARRAWSRPVAANGAAVGYLVLANRGKADTLLGATSAEAQRVELHSSAMTGGMMHMAADPGAPVPAGGQLALAPGGRHLMFIGMKRALKVGDTLPATLRFASGRELNVRFAVRTSPPGP